MLKKILLLAAIAYTIILTTVSVIDMNGVPSLGSSFDDKIYHFCAYFVLAILWITYFKPSNKTRNIIIAFVVLILYGVILELVQHQLNPNRTYDTFDLISNCLGVVVGTLIAKRLEIDKLK